MIRRLEWLEALVSDACSLGGKMRAARWVFFASVTPFIAACGVAVQSGALFSRGWEPDRLTTFTWHDDMEHVSGDSRLEDNTFFHARLREAVEWELNLRGIRYGESDASLLVRHHMSLADHETELEVVSDADLVGPEFVSYEGGSVVIHMEDVSTGEDVWFAWAQANIESAFNSPGAMRNWAYRLVGELFKEWDVPPRVAAN